ncbi:MAG: HTTM domain-containing protein, partial [Deltaproteobacteria bacterium]|nr:HTTM domain-containing protein [Deltaproteobacteria bacterium]
MTERLRALRERLATPVDATGLATFRILFGLLVAFGALRFLWNGWIDELYVAPRYHFHYLGFDWVRVWPGWGMHAHFVGLAGLGLLVALGAFYRPAIVLLFLAFTYVELLDVTAYLNHYYLVSLLALLLCFLPAAATWSVDAARRPGVQSDTVPLAAPVALRLQLGIVYFFAGLAKLGEDWLVHAQPLNIWLSSRTELPLVGPLLGDPRVALAMGWAGFLYDTTIPLWLSLPRTRLVAFVVLLGFHGATGLLFPIGLFPLIMTTGALVFFPQDLPRRLLARFTGRGPSRPVVGTSRGPLPALAFAALATHVGLQVLIPLRHHLYGGDVLWHE